MKRKISAILILSIIISTLSVFSVNTFADTEYERLLEQSREYIGDEISSFYYPLYSPPLTVLLYTDAAKKFTFEKGFTYGGTLVGRDHDWFVIGGFGNGDYYLTSPEISAAIKKCETKPYGARESRSALREAVKYFDISKVELVEAFRKMKEEPDYIRPLLTILTDEEFEKTKGPDGTFGKTDWPEFVIEAMYIEDDAKAHDLLTYRNAVYIPELGRVTEIYEICKGEEYLKEKQDAGNYLTIDDLISFDLTTDSMGLFIEHLRKRVDEDTAIEISEERMAMLEAAREYQLANPKPPQTGEEVYLIPVALVSLALGALVIYPRRRKIDNI